jgi:signal transduction histidine kinase/CheY-like chemotaxis protein
MPEPASPAASALPRRVLAEQLRLIIAQSPQGVAGPAALLLISALLVWPGNDSTLLAVAISLVLAALAWWLWFYGRFRRDGIDPERSESWLWRATWGTAAHGAAWGLYSLMIFSPRSVTYQSLDVAFMYGLVAGAVVVDAPHFRLFLAFALPTLLPVIARCLLQGTPTGMGVGFAGLVGLGHGLFAASSSARVTQSSIRTRFDNLDLVSQLERERELAEAARAEAESANRAKSRFLAAASHDLRQPVHALGLFADALQRARSDGEARHIARQIEASVAALSASFDALLEVSRLDAGVLQVKREAVALGPLLGRLADEYGRVARERGLGFACRARELHVLTDAVLLERILRNLLDNAIRYTSRGRVLLAARRRAGLVRLEVWDSGIGIAPAEQAQVFEEFYQVGNPERDRRQGVGLGLSIVKRTAALLGHPLSLASRVGKGTRVALELPSGTTAAPDAPAPFVDLGTASLMGCVVVVIDDDPAALAATELLLRELGARVIAADSVVVALERLTSSELVPDLVVSDYRLRGEHTGIAALATLRGKFGHTLPGVLVTGDTISDELRQLSKSGLLVLHKPVTPSRLTQALLAQLA